MAKKVLSTKIKKVKTKPAKKMKGGALKNITNLIIEYEDIKSATYKVRPGYSNLEVYKQINSMVKNLAYGAKTQMLNTIKSKLPDAYKIYINSQKFGNLEKDKDNIKQKIKERFDNIDIAINEIDEIFLPCNGNSENKCVKFKPFKFCDNNDSSVIDTIKTNWDLNKITKLQYKKFKNSFQININDKIFTIYYYEDVLNGNNNEKVEMSEIDIIKKKIRKFEETHNLKQIATNAKNRINIKNTNNKYNIYSKISESLNSSIQEQYNDLLGKLEEILKKIEDNGIIDSKLTFDTREYFIKAKYPNIRQTSIPDAQNILDKNFTSKYVILSDFIMKIEDYNTLLNIDTIIKSNPTYGRKLYEHQILQYFIKYFQPQFDSIVFLISSNNKNICEKNMLHQNINLTNNNSSVSNDLLEL